jgi:hypothetical protein
MPRDPVTTTTVPAPPPTVLGPLLLATVAVFVLFVLPPCATSPDLDLAVLAGVGLGAGWALVRALRWPRRPTGRASSLPRQPADNRDGRPGAA